MVMHERYEDRLPWFLKEASAKNIYHPDSKASYVVVDFEATYGPGPTSDEADLVLAAWTIYSPSYEPITKYCWGDEFSMGTLLEDIEAADFFVAHGAKYELQWLKRCGLDLRNALCWCTMLGQWVLDGNLGLPKSLADLCKKYRVSSKWDLIKLLWKTGLRTQDIPRSWLLEYCLQDIKSTHEIFVKQLQEVYDRDQQHLVLQRCVTAACLADIEFNGMLLDPERVEVETKRVTEALDECETKLRELSGGINFGSPKQLGEFLYDELGFEVPKDNRGKPMKTGSGGRPTGADALSRLVVSNTKQEEFLELYRDYNRLSSLLSKNLSFFKGVCDNYNSRFLGVFNQGIAKTHRLTSSGVPLLFPGEKSPKRVQFQNLPREYKRLFCADEDTGEDSDYLTGEADGSQLEFRVAAEMGQDRLAYKEICEGADVHAVTAQQLLEHGQEGFADMTAKQRRQEAKSRTFRPLYGGESGSDAEKAYIRFFAEKYQGIATTQNNWALSVVNDKKLRTAFGMEFFWPDVSVNRAGRVNHKTSIYNYPIQSAATAEIIPIALVLFWHLSKDIDVRIINTVHDSIITRVHKNDVAEYEELSVYCFTTGVYEFLREVYNYSFRVPLGCGIKLAKHWGDTNSEVSYDVYPDGTVVKKEK